MKPEGYACSFDMKYGRLVYRYTGKTYIDTDAIFSYGDVIQTLAIDHFYEKMGIDQSQIVDINFAEMKDYDGEYVILPVAGYASHYKRFNQLPPSHKIIPLFYSFEMSDETCDDIVPYLKKHEPIGCRDEHTMNLLRRKGVVCYLSGCVTVTFPRRSKKPIKNKVFFVDIPNAIEKYIPQELKENCEYIQQEGKVKTVPMTEEERIQIEEEGKRLIQRYKDEAALVVTSRLHAAAPCAAMGIPVILTIDNIDGRFSFLDKLIPLYDSVDYEKIDWYPKSIAFDELKESMFAIFKEKMLELYEHNQKIYDLSAYWENREKALYDRKLYMRLKELQCRHTREDEFPYLIWGGGVHGKRAFSMMKELFPKAELVAVVDKYMEGSMFEKPIIRKERIAEFQFDYTLITTHLGRFEAVETLKDLNKEYQKEYCFFISKDLPECNENVDVRLTAISDGD